MPVAGEAGADLDRGVDRWALPTVRYLAPPAAQLLTQAAVESPTVTCFAPNWLSLTTPVKVDLSAAKARHPKISNVTPSIVTFRDIGTTSSLWCSGRFDGLTQTGLPPAGNLRPRARAECFAASPSSICLSLSGFQTTYSNHILIHENSRSSSAALRWLRHGAMVQRIVQLYLRFDITRPDTGTGNWWVALDAKAADSVESKSRTRTRYDST